MKSLSSIKYFISRICLISIIIMGSSFSGIAIAANDGIAVLIAIGGELNNQDEKCLTKELRGLDTERTVLTGMEFRDSLFPFFEPKYAPDTVEEFSVFLAKPGIKTRIESMGLRYVVSVVGLNTKLHDDKGAFWCGFAMDFSGCYGMASVDETTTIATIVWDLNDIENSRVTNAVSSGKNVIVGFLLPLPLKIANSEGQACKEMAQQLTTYIEGGDLQNASPISEWEADREEERRKREAAIAVYDPNVVTAYERGSEYISLKSSEAWELLCIAANAGHGKAQEELAFWHRTDIHIPNEPPQFRSVLSLDDRVAYMWYRLAELNDATGAGDGMQYLSTRLTEEELDEAKQMVIDWKPGQCPAPP